MRILVTGAKGFVGKKLCEALKNIRDGKDKSRPLIKVDEVYEYDIDFVYEQLQDWCQKADFVFNLAGVNQYKMTLSFLWENSDLYRHCLIHYITIKK